MRLLFPLLLSTLGTLVPGLAFANTIGVHYFEASETAKDLEGLKVGLAQMIVTDITGGQGYDVLERTQLQKVLEELDLGHSGMVDPNSAAQIGKLLGVRYFLFGSFMKLGKMLRIDTRIVDVETGKIIGAYGAHGGMDEFMRIESDIAKFTRNTMEKLPAASSTPIDTAPAPTHRDRPTPTPKPGVEPTSKPSPRPAGTKTPTRATPTHTVASTPEMYAPDPKAVEAAMAYSEGLIFMDAGEDTKARERFETALVAKPDLAHAKSALTSVSI